MQNKARARSSGSKAEYVSDVIVDVMRELGIEYVALNPGASIRGLHDSLVQYGGDEDPKSILCCHEEIAVALAVGYAHVKHKPIAVMVHDIVGLQHATKAIYEAWLERAPVLVIGGTGPMDIGKRRPWLDWIHTALTNGELVRDYVKWDDQPFGEEAAVESLVRGYRICTTRPYGPVYVCYDLELQEQRVQHGNRLPPVSRFEAPEGPEAKEDVISRAAEILRRASNPVMIAETAGRSPEAFRRLSELAEMLSIPVIDKGHCLNISNMSPFDVTGAEEEVLKDADVVLGVDVFDLERALTAAESTQSRETRSLIGEKTKIMSIGLNEYSIRAWTADYRRIFPVDVPILADSAAALAQLVEKCKKGDRTAGRKDVAERRKQASALHERLRRGWASQLKERMTTKPVSTARLAWELWNAVQDEEWVLVHGSLNGWVRKLWELPGPERYLGSGLGTGCGMGETIGAALAYAGTSSLCVSIVNDGDLLYTPSSLWTAAKYSIPMLVVMFNNRSYYQDEGHQLLMAKMRNRDPKKVGIGIRIEGPEPDFAGLATSLGVNGTGPVTDPSKLAEALRAGVDFVTSKRRPAVVDVVTQGR